MNSHGRCRPDVDRTPPTALSALPGAEKQATGELVAGPGGVGRENGDGAPTPSSHTPPLFAPCVQTHALLHPLAGIRRRKKNVLGSSTSCPQGGAPPQGLHRQKPQTRAHMSTWFLFFSCHPANVWALRGAQRGRGRGYWRRRAELVGEGLNWRRDFFFFFFRNLGSFVFLTWVNIFSPIYYWNEYHYN